MAYDQKVSGNNRRVRNTLLGGVAGLAVLAGGAEMASAQLDEIVVYSQKREQSLQDVPISVAAFTPEFLDDANVTDVFDLQAFTPGLVVFRSQTAGVNSFQIRGVGTSSNNAGLESSVGVFVDGVFRQRQASGIADIVDVESVEVLRGPQGSLFGKNTSSGAIQFRTVAPQIDEFSGYGEIQGGNFGFANFNGAVNIPLLTNKLALRLTGSATEREGFVENITTGTDTNDRSRFSFRGQLLYEPRSDLSIRVIGDFSELNEVCCSAVNSQDGPADTPALFAAAVGNGLIPAFDPFATGMTPQVSFAAPAAAFGGTVLLADTFNDDITNANLDPFTSIKEWGISGEVNYGFRGHTLTSITAYRSFEQNQIVDADFGDLDAIINPTSLDQSAFTHEMRIANDDGERFKYTFGGFFFTQQLDTLNQVIAGADLNETGFGGATFGSLLLGGPLAGFAPFITTEAFPEGLTGSDLTLQDQTSWALFAQTDYELTDKITLTGGIRFTTDTKKISATFNEIVDGVINPPTADFSAFGLPAPLPFAPGPVGFPGGVVPNAFGANNFTAFSFQVQDFTDELVDRQVTGTAKISYFVNDDILTYASFARGFKSGGTNTARLSVNAFGEPVAPAIFEAETATSYEVGVKASGFQNKLRVNFSLYRTTFDDFQANVFVGTAFALQNAGQITTRGGELEIFSAPTEWLDLNVGLGIADAKYTDFADGVCIQSPLTGDRFDPAFSSPDATDPGFPTTCSNSGNRVALSPLITLNAGAQVTQPITDKVAGYARLDVIYTSRQETTTSNDPNAAIDAFTLVNARLGVNLFEDRFDLSAWARNIFDEDIDAGGFNAVGREGSLSAFHTSPRFFGVTGRVKFN